MYSRYTKNDIKLFIDCLPVSRGELRTVILSNRFWEAMKTVNLVNVYMSNNLYILNRFCCYLLLTFRELVSYH